jgi:hypothetical protein
MLNFDKILSDRKIEMTAAPPDIFSEFGVMLQL